MATKMVLPCWFVILLASFFHVSQAQSPTTISLGSTLTAGTSVSNWSSLSGDFAFGFYPIGNGRYLIGIWFDKIPNKTLIWSANRNQPAPGRSIVRLAMDGSLAASYSDGHAFQIYRGGAPAASTALMKDDGNFVLIDSSSTVLWESFSFPTNTIVPGQGLVEGQNLYSNANGTVDYSTGRFKLAMQGDGNLVLSTYNFSDPGYWYTNTLQHNVSLIFNQSGIMYLENRTNIIHLLTIEAPAKPVEYYHRAMIDDYGNFKQQVFRKGSSGQWTTVWRAIDQPCTVNSVCGVYGICNSPDNQTVQCQCLPGTTPRDSNNPSKGCYRDVVPDQYCRQKPSSINIKVEVIDDADNVNDPVADLGQFSPADEENCTKAVMDDCYCTGATLVNSTCHKKRAPLFNTRRSSDTNGKKLLIKVGIQAKKPNRRKNDPLKVLQVGLWISVTLASLFIGLAAYYFCVVRRYRKRYSHMNASVADVNLREFTFQELSEATNGFSNKLGQGSFGSVYSGTLTSKERETEIAVKQLKMVLEQGEKEFVTELRVIGRTHHKNLVRLVGFCYQDNNRILVYELLKNGTLASLLFKEAEKPSWDLRVQIALGIAKGLAYLHEECDRQIIHCDIKPQNVLLDEKYSAKIADFGMAKLLMINQSRTKTDVRGTLGYIAPEWLKHVPVTTKVDIYSFGVVLLEIICCRRHIELSRVEEETEDEDLHLIEWVASCTRRGNLEPLVSHDMEVLSDFKRFERMAMAGLWCVHPNPCLRPGIKKVIQMLEGVIEVGVPPLLYEP